MEYPFREWEKHGFDFDSYISWRFVTVPRKLALEDQLIAELDGGVKIYGKSKSQLLAAAYSLASSNGIEIPMHHYFSPEEAASWREEVARPQEALEWLRWGFTPETRKEFLERLPGRQRSPHSFFIIAAQPYSIDTYIAYYNILEPSGNRPFGAGNDGSRVVSFTNTIRKWFQLQKDMGWDVLSDNADHLKKWIDATKANARACREYIEYFGNTPESLEWAGCFGRRSKLAIECSKFYSDPNKAWEIPTYEPRDVPIAVRAYELGVTYDRYVTWDDQTKRSGWDALCDAMERSIDPLKWDIAERDNHHLRWYSENWIRDAFRNPIDGSLMIRKYGSKLEEVLGFIAPYLRIDGLSVLDAVACFEENVSPETIKKYLDRGIPPSWAIENEKEELVGNPPA